MSPPSTRFYISYTVEFFEEKLPNQFSEAKLIIFDDGY